MRTTLTIDDDVLRALKDLAHQRGLSFKALVNETLGRALTSADQAAGAPEPFHVASAARGFRPGVDPLKLNQLNDELEDCFLSQTHDAGQRRR